MEDGRHASAHLAARLQRIPTTPYTWMIVIVAAGAMIVEALDIGSLAIILPPVKQLMHLSPGKVGILAASSALGIAIGMVPTGFLADRLGRKRLLMGGLLWFTAATMLAALSPNYLVLVLLRGLAGLGMAPVFIMPYAIVSEFVSSTTRAAFAGLLETALGIGYLLPPVLGLLVVPHFSADVSWRIFLFIAGTPMLYVLVIWRYLPESPRWLSRVGRQGEAEEIVTALERRIEALLGRKLPPVDARAQPAHARAAVQHHRLQPAGRGVGRVGGRDVIGAGLEQPDLAARRPDLNTAGRPRFEMQVERALRQEESGRAVVERYDIERRRIVETDRGGADLELEAGAGLGPKGLAGDDRVVERRRRPGLLIGGME
jgi:hypothetical protein